MPKALITGINGFTGKYLQKELEEAGYDVYGTALHDSAYNKNFFKLDIVDSESVHKLIDKIKPNVIAHLAGLSFVPHSDINEIYHTHIIGTRNILSAVPDSTDAVLLASSAHIYGNINVEHPIDEETLANPISDYAVSKLAMEYMSHLWMDKLPITIVRPFNYTGIGQSLTFLLPKIVHHFKERAAEIELGNLDIARDFSDVRTIVKYYTKLMTSNTSGKTFNVCSGSTYSLHDIISIMEKIAGYKIRVKINPTFIRSNEVKYLCGSNAKLAAAVGAITPIPLTETLCWMYEKGP